MDDEDRPLDPDMALLLTRVLIAGSFLWHGVPRALDPASAMEKFAGFDLPPLLGPVTGWAEVLAGPLLLGLLHRVVTAILLVIIAGALVTVPIPAGVTAGLERDLLILAGLLVLFTVGPGAAAASGPRAG